VTFAPTVTGVDASTLTLDDIDRAAARLAGVAHVTPELTSRTLDERTGGRIRLKAECFQRTGSFKFRGAYNAVAALDPAARAAGVVAFSSGNHGQALSLAAALHDAPAVVVMPSDAPAIKKAATAGYGAEVVEYDRYTESREAIGDRIAEERGLALIPPFDHWDVMAGQGTLARELFATEPVDTIVVCVGGGGLVSGCATVAKAHGDVRVVGVEPAAGDDVKRSLETGQRVTLAETPHTIADGQQTTSCGDKTFAIIRDRVDEIVTVTDAEIVAAMRFAFERLNIVLEPSGASALAAVLAGRVATRQQRVGVTLSGGNVDLARFRVLTGDD
jgi:threonine dehydratase